ncbi:MAG TPA: hypothetical protein PLK99_11640 [Burkholderiales bacterium]|nr:hypothetical protein [Burkholderiales bacterium]
MAVNPKQRKRILGIALVLTVAAVASVSGNEEKENRVVQPEIRKARAEKRETSGILLERLRNRALPEDVKDMFATKSWHADQQLAAARKGPVRPVAPALPFVFIGKMIDSDGKVVVFLSQQGKIYTASEGDTLGGNYHVDSVRAPSMTLTYLPMKIRQTMQIGEAN